MTQKKVIKKKTQFKIFAVYRKQKEKEKKNQKKRQKDEILSDDIEKSH